MKKDEALSKLDRDLKEELERILEFFIGSFNDADNRFIIKKHVEEYIESHHPYPYKVTCDETNNSDATDELKITIDVEMDNKNHINEFTVYNTGKMTIEG